MEIILTAMLVVAATSIVATPSHAELSAAMCSGTEEAAQLPPEQDAVSAAPQNHLVLFENEELRLLEVIVQPGERESLHHHKWPSVLVVDAFPKIEIYGEDGNRIASRAQGSTEPPVIMRVPPQLAAHSIHNVGSKPFHAIRIEYKTACEAK